MPDIAQTVARLLGNIMPEWVSVPDISFSPPHLVYWIGLIVFPLISIYLLHRSRAEEDGPRIRISIAGLLWFWGGFAGLHRFYLRSAKMALVLVALFLLVLHGNDRGELARNALSNADNEVRSLGVLEQRYERRLARGRTSAQEQLEETRRKLERARTLQATAEVKAQDWRAFSGFFVLLIALILLHDLIRMRPLYRRALEYESRVPPPGEEVNIIQRGLAHDPREGVRNPVSDFIDRISGWTGRYIAWWSVIAVFVYYFEVISRYVFNSPTNWAHESMFLMFGMQYVLSGAYALREGSHVRVDVIYERFSTKTRAILDVVTSVFFFIFAGTLLVTGILFAAQAIGDAEVSFNEWGIQYWPVKSMIAVGALLILMQGIAHLIRDIQYLRHIRRQPEEA